MQEACSFLPLLSRAYHLSAKSIDGILRYSSRDQDTDSEVFLQHMSQDITQLVFSFQIEFDADRL